MTFTLKELDDFQYDTLNQKIEKLNQEEYYFIQLDENTMSNEDFYFNEKHQRYCFEFYADNFIKINDNLKEKLIYDSSKNLYIYKNSNFKPITNNTGTLLDFLIFKTNYKNSKKEYIKKILSKIPTNKLNSLKFCEITTDKLDKFNNPIKTNIKKIKDEIRIYYQKADLSIINQFLKKTVNGFLVKEKKKQEIKIMSNKQLIVFSSKSKFQINDKNYFIQLNGKQYHSIAFYDDFKEKNISLKIDIRKYCSENDNQKANQMFSQFKNEKTIENFNKLYLFLKSKLN